MQYNIDLAYTSLNICHRFQLATFQYSSIAQYIYLYELMTARIKIEYSNKYFFYEVLKAFWITSNITTVLRTTLNFQFINSKFHCFLKVIKLSVIIKSGIISRSHCLEKVKLFTALSHISKTTSDNVFHDLIYILYLCQRRVQPYIYQWKQK